MRKTCVVEDLVHDSAHRSSALGRSWPIGFSRTTGRPPAVSSAATEAPRTIAGTVDGGVAQ